MCSHGPVLIVEDDEGLRLALVDTFTISCGAAMMARDGAEALRMVLAGAAPSAIVTDIHMPKLGGRELITALVDAGFGDIPVITISGDDRTRGHSADFAKPFDARKVIEAVHARFKHLARPSAPGCDAGPP